MSKAINKLEDVSREEDYRDYEARDTVDGWPYADEDGLPSGRNSAYGRTSSNFDESARVGADISRETRVESTPAIGIVEEEPKRLFDDNLEDRISNALELDGRIEMSLIEIQVDNGVVTLSGKVESDYLRRLAEGAALSASGVKHCRNHITVMGVDSSLPDAEDAGGL